MYGKGTANQRIEYWWCNLGKHNVQFWINLFEILNEQSMLNGCQLDKCYCLFCDDYTSKSSAKVWIAYRIRGTREIDCIWGGL